MFVADLWKNKKMNKILVTGASGYLGTAVIETMLKTIPPNQISTLSRKKETQKEFEANGFNSFLGSYDDSTSIENALREVDTVLLISSGDQGDRMQEHKNVVDKAKKLGVKGIAYTSRCLHQRSTLVNKLMLEHFETEDYIKASGMGYTFFRNILYMDLIPLFIGGQVALERGIILPGGEGKVSFALRSEMGEAIANVLMREDCTDKIYNLTGDKAYSFHEIAVILTDLSGREVQYTSVDETVFAEILKQRNIPKPVIQKMINFISDIRQNQEADIYNDLENILGRKPTDLKVGLKQLFEL